MPNVIYRDFVQIPVERVGALIGRGGSVKKEIEETYGVKLEVDSSTGRVCIELLENSNPANLLVVKNIIQAIGYGMNPEKALKIFSEEDAALHVIDLKYLLGPSRDNLVRVKGRLIGEKGKARKLIEELTNTVISISEHTVAIAGKLENVEVARRAIEMLISGSPHGVVWSYLYTVRRKLKRRGFALWEPKTVSLELEESVPEGEEEGEESG
ncbi:MAG: KH domain-containing protein [Candidatus Nezhaarchaeales archaeon]|nr:MAG: RNA-processing protein [Candidatus Nezhaarchaeota archaeon WYZ-LMO8]TDA35633.1 MAG: RNA-processing protein [Candidatus Nezhaarchaeota archaeon WYZ-LMO7]